MFKAWGPTGGGGGGVKGRLNNVKKCTIGGGWPP